MYLPSWSITDILLGVSAVIVTSYGVASDSSSLFLVSYYIPCGAAILPDRGVTNAALACRFLIFVVDRYSVTHRKHDICRVMLNYQT